MVRHNIIGSQVGRSLAPGHGSIRGYRPRRRTNALLPVSFVVAGLAFFAALAAAAFRLVHP